MGRIRSLKTQFKIPVTKQNGPGDRRLRRKRKAHVLTVYKNQKRSISRVRQQKSRKGFTLQTRMLRCESYPSTPMYLPSSKQNVLGALPYRGQPNGHVQSFSGYENLSSTFNSKSSYFDTSFKPSLHELVACNNPASHCSDKAFRSEKQLSCPSARVSQPSAAFDVRKLVSGCIRNSKISVNKSLAFSTTPYCDRSYSRPLSTHTIHSTPKDHSALGERGIIGVIARNVNKSSLYPHVTLRISPIENASLMISSAIPKDSFALKEKITSILENTSSSSSTAEPHSLTESSRQSSELLSDAPPNSSDSQISSKGSWVSDDDTERINHCFVSGAINLDYLSFKRNFAKSNSEENSPNNTPLRNENSSKISMFPVKRRCPSKLQVESSPPSNSKTLLRESKHIENATESVIQPSPHSVMAYHRPVKRSSTNSKETNLFSEENVRSYSALENNDSLMPLYPESSPLHVGEFLATLNPSLSSLEETCRSENTVESLRQSFSSLSVSYGSSTTKASEMVIPSNEPDSEQIAHSRNKTKKKSKIISCFTSCFCPPSPRKKVKPKEAISV